MALAPNHAPPKKPTSPPKDVKERKASPTEAPPPPQARSPGSETDDPNNERAARKFGGKAARDYYNDVVKRRKRKTLIVKDWSGAQATSEPWGLCVSLTRMFENVELTTDITTFGRNPECTVNYFSSATISGLHCQLRREKDKSGKTRIFLKDFSTNGTWINRKKLSRGEEVRIRSGEEFWLFPNDNPLAKVGYIFYLKEVKPRDSVEALKAPQGQVTFVFTDVQSSTTLWEQESVAMDKALAMHDHIFRTLILKFKGFEVKTEGDAFMVTFYHTVDAVKWCLAVQDALNNHTWPERLVALKEACIEKGSNGKIIFNGLRVRMGINTGRPFCRVNPVTNRMDYYGPVVNCSARVSDTANGGQIVCTQEVADCILKCKEEGGEEKQSPRSSEDFSEPLPSPSHVKNEHDLNFPIIHEEVKVADIDVRYLETLNLKGISEPVKIFDVSFPSLSTRKFPALRNKGRKKSDDETHSDSKNNKPKRSSHLRSPTIPAESRDEATGSPTSLSRQQHSPSSNSGMKTRPVSPQPSPLSRNDNRFSFHPLPSPEKPSDDELEREPDFDARIKIIRQETIQKLARNRTKKPSKSFLIKEPLLPDADSSSSSSSSSSSMSTNEPDDSEDLLTPLPTSSSSLSVSIPASPPPRRAPSRPHSSSVPNPPTPKQGGSGSGTPRQTIGGGSGSETPKKVAPSRPPASRPPNPSLLPSASNSTSSQQNSPRSNRSTSLNRPAPPQRKAPAKPKVPNRAPPRLPASTTV